MQGTHDHPGIVPLAVNEAFEFIKNSTGREWLMRMSYLEIYNEQIFDLLNTNAAAVTSKRRGSLGRGAQGVAPSTKKNKEIKIFEQKGRGMVIKNLTETVVIAKEQVFGLIQSGEAQRHVGSTQLNKNSSRSHTIFRLVIESKPQFSSGSVRVSTLSLVDLAGSESVKQARTTGIRKKEGHYINKSLLTLGHVIWKLSERAEDSRADDAGNIASDKTTVGNNHIPYRDSKLTRLLQPSLEGNAQISIICNISPNIQNSDESHNTLKFASRAKRIKQTTTITEIPDDATLLQLYKEEIETLKKQLERMKGEKTIASTISATSESPTKIVTSPTSDEFDYDQQFEEEEEETHAISTAIHNLERLILRNEVNRKSSSGR